MLKVTTTDGIELFTPKKAKSIRRAPLYGSPSVMVASRKIARQGSAPLRHEVLCSTGGTPQHQGEIGPGFGDTHYFSSSINTDGDSEQDESSSREAQDHQEPVGTAHGALEHMRGLNFDFCGESLVKVWPTCGDEYFVLVMFY